MIDWREVDTVLLDMDGTLLDLYYDNYFWHEYLPLKWGERRGLDAESARAELLPRLHSRRGTLSWYCLDFWSGELDINIMALKSDIEHLIRIRPYAEDLLGHVRGLGKDVILVTNAHRDLMEVKLERTGIRRYFHAVVCAHTLGIAKEEVGFWKSLAARHDFDPGRTVLIDDNPDVLRSAGAYGIRNLLTIEQPDSRSPPRAPCEFPAITSFTALLHQATA